MTFGYLVGFSLDTSPLFGYELSVIPDPRHRSAKWYKKPAQALPICRACGHEHLHFTYCIGTLYWYLSTHLFLFATS